MRKILAAALASTLLVGGAVASVAIGGTLVDAQEGEGAGDPAEEAAPEHGRLPEALQALVDDGTLTAEQAGAVVTALRETVRDLRPLHRRGHLEGHLRMGAMILDRVLDDLVADGTITQEQADAVREAVRAEACERLAARRLHPLPGILSEALDDLVADGTITQEQADAVVEALRERLPCAHAAETDAAAEASEEAAAV